jgi:hypothetical protein
MSPGTYQGLRDGEYNNERQAGYLFDAALR